MINQMSINGVVNCAVTMNGYLYIAGKFNAINGITYYNFAEINLSTGNLTSFIPRFDNAITAMDACTSSDTNILVVGGGFLNIDGNSNPYLALMFQSSHTFGTNVIEGLGLQNFKSSGSLPFPTITETKFHTNSGFVFVCGSFICNPLFSNTKIYNMLIFNAFSLAAVLNSNVQGSFLYDDFDIDQVNNILFYSANQ